MIVRNEGLGQIAWRDFVLVLLDQMTLERARMSAGV